MEIETRNLAGVLGRLALGVIEICRNGNDSLLDLLTEIGFGGLLHLLQDEGRNLRGGIGLAFDLHPRIPVRGPYDLVGDKLFVLLDHRVVVAPADEALHRKNGTLGIGDCLAFGRLSNKSLAIVRKSDDGGRGAHAFRVLDDLRRLAFHDGDARIRGAEVDANDLAHDA